MTKANDAESSGTDLFKQGGGSLSRTAAFVDGLEGMIGLGGTYLLYFLMMAMVEESQSNTEFRPCASWAGSPQ